MKRTVRTDIGEVTVREPGLVYAKAFSGVEITLKQVKEYHSMVEYLSKSEPHITVLDISGLKYMSKESREFISKRSSDWGKTLGVALIVNSFTARMIANFFLTVNRPQYPIKVFTDSLLAQQWARSEYHKLAAKLAS